MNNSVTPQVYQGFIERHRLDNSYLEFAQEWFKPVVSALVAHQKSAGRTLFLGLNGCQGSGKSTLSDYLVTTLAEEHGLNAIALSLDDFYLSQEKRQALAEEIHPLLATRGVPGTHDIELLQTTLEALRGNKGNVPIPRFNKAIDNPLPADAWPKNSLPVDVVIFEGWCWGVEAQPEGALYAPVNSMEADQDEEGIWRCYVNDQLNDRYKPLYALMDKWLMLCAPSFDTVFQWRLQQEQLLERNLAADADRSGLMSEQDIQDFIQHFQRLTLHSLKTMPNKCDYFFELDEDRQIISSLIRPGAN